MGGLWEVVGGEEKGGVIVRTDGLADSTVGRLSTGALLEELGREAQRGVRFRRLCGLGPQEGWLKESVLERPNNIWQVTGGRSKGGILVREKCETSSPALAERLSTGALVRELERQDDRLCFQRLTGTGPDSGWVSLRLQGGQALLEPLDFANMQGPKKGSVYDGTDLEIQMFNEEKRFSYAQLPPWVPTAAAVARLWRLQKPFPPTRQIGEEREVKQLAPHKMLSLKQLEEMSKQHLPGCFYGLTFPQSSAEMASEDFGPAWLTKAFHTAGTLPKDNRVVKIHSVEELAVKGFDAAGGAAMKMFLTVEYEKADPELHTELFCKYPYSYEEYPVERRQLAYGDVDGPEILVQMSLTHLFPFRTAKFYFGDVCRETTNYILISEKIPFSQRGRVEKGKVVEEIEYEPYQVLPVCGKYQDWLLPDVAEYYCCIFRAMGRLAAWDKQGRYDDYFGPFDAQQLLRFSAERRTLRPQQLESQRHSVGRILDTAIDFLSNVVPSMLPSSLQGGKLLKIKEELLDMFHHFPGMSHQFQLNNPDYVAAMHANLQADNAFFWRDEYGDLSCGVLDWGGFNRSPFCMNFLGCLSGADPEVLLGHEEGILRCFRDEYHRCGGPKLPLDELLLRYHLGYITFVYESTTWIDREIYKLLDKEELRSFEGILDDRFQDNFRVRCRTCAIINSFTFYCLKGDYFKKLFQDWSRGKGAPYLTRVQ